MISLHDLHKRGGNVETAVMNFGRIHPATTMGTTTEAIPDWEQAELHWNKLLSFLMKTAAPKTKRSAQQTLRWAENAGTDLLMIFEAGTSAQCPVCTGLS